jgi:hypothetical protein
MLSKRANIAFVFICFLNSLCCLFKAVNGYGKRIRAHCMRPMPQFCFCGCNLLPALLQTDATTFQRSGLFYQMKLVM